MKIIPLSEGSFTIDQTKAFIPFDKNKDELQQRPTGSLLVEIQPFVIITAKDVILLDTGLGFANDNGILQVHQNLIDNDIDPLSVTKVLLSHLHKDHAGGIRKHDKVLQQSFLSFPNAIYYVNREELAFALENKTASYIPEMFALLKDSDKIILLEREGVIDNYITYRMTSAHSPFHLVYWIHEEGQTIFFGGDDAPQLQQMKSRFVAKYDYDGKKTMQLRSEWWEEGKRERWTFLFYHDIQSPSIQF
ncbi:MAG: MBL fold metallo-hydrolase [Ferruginibacter sp.]|nr:MBL fold metallo-hydrolase [Ferruginibacter sp.]